MKKLITGPSCELNIKISANHPGLIRALSDWITDFFQPPTVTTIGVVRFTGIGEEAGRESLARFGPPGSGPDPLPPVSGRRPGC